MSYILRIAIHEKSWERQLSEIIQLCKDVNIEEVYLMEQCHQVIMAPFPISKHKRMANIYKKMKVELEKNGIIYSVNIATIIGHCDTKTSKEYTLPFITMKGSSLEDCESVYCFLDTDWQEYVQEVVTLYAETSPKTIMIDDDFRSLNHKDFIGCFCELHVAATNKIIGRTLDSSMLLNGVYNEKTIRESWMHANFEGQKHVASLISAAIHKVNRNIQVGLMNSGEENHSIQGRNMDLLIASFANGNKKISRPMGGAYFDSLHLPLIGTFQSMALSISVLTDTEIVSEIENWPHTRMTKSISQTYTQMKLHALAGANKLSLNIFDYMATPYNQERLFIDLLKNKKSIIEKIIAERKEKTQIGVGLLWNQAAALHTGTKLLPERMIDTLLPSMGIVTTFNEGKINYLMGSVSKSMTDVEIMRLLSKNLFLDSEAVIDLMSRGYSEYLGITFDGCINIHSMERINDTKYSGIFTDNLVPTNYLREVNDDRKLPKIIKQKSAIEITSVLDLEQNYYSPGMTLFKNSLGGMICNMVSPVSLWAYAYRSRAFIFREIVKDMDNSANLVIENSINTAPFLFEGKNTSLFALLNSGLDEELCFVPYLNKEVRLNPLELKIYMNKEEYNE